MARLSWASVGGTGMRMREDAERGRFELEVEGRVVHAEYRREPGTLVILHVYAPPPLRGTVGVKRYSARAPSCTITHGSSRSRMTCSTACA